MASEEVPRRQTSIFTRAMSPGKKRRLGSDKSKTGCLTCRIRRVKCDETKPYCHKCTSTGRKCDGPIVQQFRFVQDKSLEFENNPGSLVAQRQLPTVFCERRERRAFAYFLHHVAPVLSGPLETQFWNSFVPKLGQFEPAVWNAMLVISSLFEHPQTSIPPKRLNRYQSAVDPYYHYHTYKWYRKAIGHFRTRIAQDAQDSSLALLSCILFTCIEFQQENVSNALALLGQGFELLCNILSTSEGTQKRSSETSAIYDIVTPFFSRHAILAKIFGQPPPMDWSNQLVSWKVLECDASSFSTLQDATVSMYRLMYHSYELIRITELRSADAEVNADLIGFQQNLLSKLREWYATFSNLSCTSESTTVLQTTYFSSNLLMYYEVAFIWTSTCLSLYETDFDMYHLQFESILHHAQTALTVSLRDYVSPPPWTLHMDIVSPLYFVAIKCRQPVLRRKALSLLKSAPQTGNLWKALPTSKIVEKVISIEEADLDRPTSWNSTCDQELLPDEKRRIHKLEVIQNATPTSRSWLGIKIGTPSQNLDGSRQLVEQVVGI